MEHFNMSKISFPEIQWEDDENQASKEQNSSEQPEDFGALLEESNSKDFSGEAIRAGDSIQGSIVRMKSDSHEVMVDIGGKLTGILDRIEIIDAEGQPKFKEGDAISAFVISMSGDEILLSMEKSQTLRSIDDLQRAHADKVPIKGKVQAVNKGGFEVIVLGKTAFCPISQMDIRFVEAPAVFIGQELEFLVERCDSRCRNIVLSRAQLLRQKAQERLAEIEAGQNDKTIEGIVTRIADFGAFVDIGGIDGLVHVSEMGFSRNLRTSDVVRVGDQVRVNVLKIDRSGAKPKISLSMKASMQDPWIDIDSRYKSGETYKGRVVRLIKSAAFIELEVGVDGFLHVSEMSWDRKIYDPSAVVKLGDQISVSIRDIDPVQKRISLSMKESSEDPWNISSDALVEGAEVSAVVDSLKGFGAIVTLASGLEGLVPISTLKQKFGEGYRKAASPGKNLDLKIAAIDQTSRRIRLTFADIDSQDEDDANYREYLKSVNEAEPKTAHGKLKEKNMGSFGKILQSKLKRFDSEN
jgi:small subunit ribosomal protein S1